MSEVLHLRSALGEMWQLIHDLCRENDRLKDAPKLSESEVIIMDSFQTFVVSYWGRVPAEQAAIAMKLRTTTVQGWMAFITGFVMGRLNAGQPVPTQDEIIAEWRKTNPPVQIISTPFGDMAKPVGSGSQADLLSELKELVARYGG